MLADRTSYSIWDLKDCAQSQKPGAQTSGGKKPEEGKEGSRGGLDSREGTYASAQGWPGRAGCRGGLGCMPGTTCCSWNLREKRAGSIRIRPQLSPSPPHSYPRRAPHRAALVRTLLPGKLARRRRPQGSRTHLTDRSPTPH